MNTDWIFNKNVLDAVIGISGELSSKQFRDGIIPCSGAMITADDLVEVLKAFSSGWYTEGEYCKQFAYSLRNFVGASDAVLTCSGSAANLLAVSAATRAFESKEKGRKYIVTSAVGFPTTIAPIIQLGYTPLFIDMDEHTLTISLDDVQSILEDTELSSQIAGFIFAHTLGFPFEAKYIRELIDVLGVADDIFFIEDSADSLGATIRDEQVGSFGDYSTFSFFPAHHITTIEGGAVLINGKGLKRTRLHKIAHSMLNWGRDCICNPGQDNVCGNRFYQDFEELPIGWDHKYTFTELGYNFKMTEFQAALGLSQMSRLGGYIDERKHNYQYLYNALSTDDSIVLVSSLYNTSSSPFGFPIMCPTNEMANKMILSLESQGIKTRRIFGGNIIKQPMMKNQEYSIYNNSTLAGSNAIMNGMFWVGCWPGLWKEDLDKIIENVFDFLESYNE